MSKEGCAVFPISQCFTARTDRHSFWKNAFGRRASLTWLQAGRDFLIEKMSGVRFTFPICPSPGGMRLRAVVSQASLAAGGKDGRGTADASYFQI